MLKNKKSKYENLENERRGRAIIDKDDKSNIESTLFNKSTTSTQLTKGDEVTKPKINPIKDSHLDFLNKNNNSSKLYNNKNDEIIQNLSKKNKQLTEEKEKLIQENEELSKENKIQKKLIEKAYNLRQILEKEIKKSENLQGLILNYKNQIQEKNTQNNEMIKKISELTQNINKIIQSYQNQQQNQEVVNNPTIVNQVNINKDDLVVRQFVDDNYKMYYFKQDNNIDHIESINGVNVIYYKDGTKENVDNNIINELDKYAIDNKGLSTRINEIINNPKYK